MSNKHPIHMAALQGDLDAIKHQLSLGVSINIKGDINRYRNAVLNLIILLFKKRKKDK